MSRIMSSYGSVSVIDTATNTVVATVAVGNRPIAVAVSPNGQDVYVTNGNDASSQSFGDRHGHQHGRGRDPSGEYPTGVGIVPPPPGVPFLAFSAVLKITSAPLLTRTPSLWGPVHLEQHCARVQPPYPGGHAADRHLRRHDPGRLFHTNTKGISASRG